VTAARSRPATERVRLYDGARLTARDLRANETFEDRLRRLHVRGIHGTWGVAIGYEVSRSAEGGGVGVGPGIAYDCAGRPIVSARPLAVAPPPPPPGSDAPSWWFDLLIRYRDEDSLLAARDPAGTVGVGCAATFEERPELRWAFAGDARGDVPPLAESARLGDDVPLARFLVGGGGVLSEPDLSLRRNAQGLVRPHIAGGRVRQGSVAISGSPLHWSATIDTTDAGFDTQVPFYFVSLADHPFGPRSGFAPLVGPDPSLGLKRLLGPFVSIASAGRSNFVLDVRSAFPVEAAKNLPPQLSRALHLKLPVAVDWVGLEPVGGCAPQFEWPVFVDLQQLLLDTFFTAMPALSTPGGER
jgi:hypothetical protein